jgi:NAD-dependent SIR2 family protein deacetylase
MLPSGKFLPKKIHFFIRLLQEKQLLQRIYTQNIDGLEHTAGIKNERLVEAHGTFKYAHCIGCHAPYSDSKIKVDFNFYLLIRANDIFMNIYFYLLKDLISKGKVPYCKKDNCKVLKRF